MKTETAVLYETGKPLKIEEVSIPELKDGQLLVKILYTGICHSQLNEISALKGEDKYLPHTLGHEASGIIEEIGPNVKKVGKGDYVVVSWIKGLGLDSSGIYYKKGEIKINAGSAATFTRYAIVSENRVTKISDKIPPKVAALFGCPIQTGGGIILNEINPERGSNIVIFGIGGVGASSLLVASGLKLFSEIIAVDINDEKLELAKKLGATKTINALKVNPKEEIMNITNGIGVDYAIEAAGSKKAMESAFECLKSGKEGVNGGLLIIAGNISKNEKIELWPFDLIRGKRIKGSWGGASNPDVDIPRYEKMYLESKLRFEDLITDEFDFKDINSALDRLREGNSCRIVVKIEG